MIERLILKVPESVKYISEWAEFGNMKINGQVIINKKYAGCGMTTYYLTNEQPVILAAPRKFLLENKLAQLPHLFYYEVPDKYDKNVHQLLHEKLAQYLQDCINCKWPPKIIVTYRSFCKACDVLRDFNIPFQVIVDEFHVITQDIEMAAEETITFLRYLKMLPDVIYLTATPESEQDLSTIQDFRGLRYIELDWPNLKTATIISKPMISTIQACGYVIKGFQDNGYFARKGKHLSKEAVFYINDVSNIVSIIKQNGLKPDEVNILMSRNEPKNKAKLSKLCSDTGMKFEIGTIPGKGERHKPYTFCTRVVFYGCDFYSTNAYTYVFADANSENRRIDIALDLPQILGRQRLKENIFRDEAILYVKTSSLNNLQTKEAFEKEKKQKIEISKRDSNAWNNIPAASRVNLAIQKPDSNYMVKYMDANGEYRFECNDIRILSDVKAWREKNKYYRKQGTIRINLRDSGFIVRTSFCPTPLDNFYDDFLEESNWRKRMSLYCDFLQEYPEYTEAVRNLTWIPEEFHRYYETLGTERIKANSFQQSRILNEVNQNKTTDDIVTAFEDSFHTGERLSKQEIKSRIQQIYDGLGIGKTAKATDLKQYFEIEETNVIVNGKKVHGYKIGRWNMS